MGRDDPKRVDGLHVHPDFRGKGYATELLKRVEQAHPGQRLTLKARPFKDKAISKDQLVAFYSNRGWQHLGDGLMEKSIPRS